MRALVVVIAACGGSVPPSPSNRAAPTTATDPAPDLAKLRVLLGPPASLPFDARAQARGCPDNQTLGAYVDMLVTTATREDAGEHWLRGGCGPFPRSPLSIDPPRDDAYWFCTIDAYTNPGGDSPWHYEVHMRVRKDDRALDLETIACPGA